MQGNLKKSIIATAVIGSIFAGGLVAFAATDSTQEAGLKSFRFGECQRPARGEMCSQGEMRGFGNKAGKGFHTMRGMHPEFMEALGITAEEAREQLQAGKTFLEVIEAKGFSEADVKAKLLEVHKQKFEPLVAEGTITQEKADLMQKLMETKIDIMLSK
ncbi:hypothetical protein F9B85_05020 [Heliorestis acidaminivorans]|uniref:DUF2680 domain-containing protein n=1 Tax=Heliorestis acidaminivorans TaxID=553427 RepID=A0A6I0F1F0_9FIRM|nr:hypothetical protein [Heliorestis acidaminivorans]KAB2953275.1 hypothetical protein F9B85_05020 [Heliorestis acidaminivorans]